MSENAFLLSGLFGSFKMATRIVDVEGFVVWVNHEYCILTGFSKEELIGKNFTELLPQHQKEKALEAHEKQFAEGTKEVSPNHWSLRKKDGQEVLVAETSFTITLEDDRPYRVGMHNEIANKIKDQVLPAGAEILFSPDEIREDSLQSENTEDLIDQRNWMASLLESLSSFLVRLSPTGYFLYSNKAIHSFLKSLSLSKKKIHDFVVEDDQKAIRNIFLHLPESKTPSRIDIRMQKETGEVSWTSWEFVALYDKSGKVKGYQGVGIDVSHRKFIEQERDQLLQHTQALNEELQANEEELRQNLERTVELKEFIEQNERKFKSLIENSFEAVVLFDEPGFITYASPSIQRTLGYQPEEMIGKKGMAFVHEDDKPQSRALLATIIGKPGERVYIQQRLRRKDGRYIWIESYSTNLLQDENVRGIVSNFRDITERVEAEEKLIKSEAALNLAQHVAKLGSIEFNLITGSISNSSEVYTIYDYDINRYPTETFDTSQYIHPDDVTKLKSLFKSEKDLGPEWLKDMTHLPREVLEQVESEPFEFRIISAKGRLKYLRSRHRFFLDNAERAVKLILTIQDVSEEMHRKRLLDETSRISKIGGWELDVIQNKVMWTRETYNLFEVPPDGDLTIEKAVAFYYPDYQPVLQEAFQKLLAEGIPFDLELKIRAANDREKWIRLRGECEIVNQKVVLAKGTMQDISEKKEAEQELQEYAERLRLASEVAEMGIWDWDLLVNKMVWDTKLMDIFGFQDKRKVDYDDFQSALHPDDVVFQNSLMQEVLQGKKTETEFRIISHPSGLKWIKSYAKVFYDEKGKPIRIVGVNWDITRVKKIEEDLRRNNDELSKTNEELDHFVYSTSHNLRAPLTSILGIVNLMKNYPNPDDYLTYIDLIERSVMKLDETIQEITNYSRNTRVEVSVEPVHLEFLIEEVVESLSFLEGAEKIRMSYIAPNSSVIYSDSSRLKMIFTNLISNAIKYFDPAERDPYILILVEEHSDCFSIKIKDNGIGIAKEHQQKIFNMFFRASTKSTGSGLGLYIVREAIKKIGGSIKVQSELGSGTEFKIELPRQV